jgi:hypothetical protein
VTNKCLVCTGLDWRGSGRLVALGCWALPPFAFEVVAGLELAAAGLGWLATLLADPELFAEPERAGDAANIGLPWLAMSRPEAARSTGHQDNMSQDTT